MNNTHLKNKYFKYKIKYLNKIKIKGGNPFKYYVLFRDKDGQTYEIILPLFDNKLYLTIGLDIISFSDTIFNNLIVKKIFPYINELCANIYNINIIYIDDFSIELFLIYIVDIEKLYLPIKEKNIPKIIINKNVFYLDLINCLKNNKFFYCTINSQLQGNDELHATYISIKYINGDYILTVYDDCDLSNIILDFFNNEFDLNLIYDKQCSNLDLQERVIRNCINIDEKINIWHQIYGKHIIKDTLIEQFYTNLLKENIIKSCLTYSTLYFLFCLCNPLIEQRIIINFLQDLFYTNPYTIIRLILSYHQYIYKNYSFILKKIDPDMFKIYIDFIKKYDNPDKYVNVIKSKILLEKSLEKLDFFPKASQPNKLSSQSLHKPSSTYLEEPLEEPLEERSIKYKTSKFKPEINNPNNSFFSRISRIFLFFT